jgi:hypothetical protein
MSETKLELLEKIMTLATVYYKTLDGDTRWANEFLDKHDIGVLLSALFWLGYIEALDNTGVDMIEKTFSNLADAFGMSESDFAQEVNAQEYLIKD